MSGISLEELIQALEVPSNQTETKVFKKPEYNKNEIVVDFIKNNKIISGLDKVKSSIIYYHYIKNRNKKEPLIKKIMFFKIFKQIFKQVRHGNQRFYLLDKSTFDYSREGLLYVEKHEKELNKNRKNNSKQKK